MDHHTREYAEAERFFTGLGVALLASAPFWLLVVLVLIVKAVVR